MNKKPVPAHDTHRGTRFADIVTANINSIFHGAPVASRRTWVQRPPLAQTTGHASHPVRAGEFPRTETLPPTSGPSGSRLRPNAIEHQTRPEHPASAPVTDRRDNRRNERRTTTTTTTSSTIIEISSDEETVESAQATVLPGGDRSIARRLVEGPWAMYADALFGEIYDEYNPDNYEEF